MFITGGNSLQRGHRFRQAATLARASWSCRCNWPSSASSFRSASSCWPLAVRKAQHVRKYVPKPWVFPINPGSLFFFHGFPHVYWQSQGKWSWSLIKYNQIWLLADCLKTAFPQFGWTVLRMRWRWMLMDPAMLLLISGLWGKNAFPPARHPKE